MKKYNFDEHYFDVIDCQEKAYWLGFICADGYIGKDFCRGCHFFNGFSCESNDICEKCKRCKNLVPKAIDSIDSIFGHVNKHIIYKCIGEEYVCKQTADN